MKHRAMKNGTKSKKKLRTAGIMSVGVLLAENGFMENFAPWLQDRLDRNGSFSYTLKYENSK